MTAIPVSAGPHPAFIAMVSDGVRALFSLLAAFVKGLVNFVSMTLLGALALMIFVVMIADW